LQNADISATIYNDMDMRDFMKKSEHAQDMLKTVLFGMDQMFMTNKGGITNQ
jgi:hypothetical protein